MRTERGFDRIVNFSDATVAIAMTLLVLPLVDLGGESVDGESVWTLIGDHWNVLFAFVLGFLVIWSMWVTHHRILEYFAGYDSMLLRLHLLWLLTMVLIPFTTQLIASPHLSTGGATTVYVAVLLVSSVALHLLGRHGRRHRELLHTDRPEVEAWLAGPFTWTTPVVLAVILVIVSVVPGVGAWPMLLLFVDGGVERWLERRSALSRHSGKAE